MLPAHLPTPVVKLGAVPVRGTAGDRRESQPEKKGKVCAAWKT